MEQKAKKANPEEKKKGAEMLDFWAPWCGHCKMMGRVVDQLREEWKGRVEVRKVDADAQRPVAERYNISALPTFIFLRGGKEVSRLVGATTKERLESKLKDLVR